MGRNVSLTETRNLLRAVRKDQSKRVKTRKRPFRCPTQNKGKKKDPLQIPRCCGLFSLGTSGAVHPRSSSRWPTAVAGTPRLPVPRWIMLSSRWSLRTRPTFEAVLACRARPCRILASAGKPWNSYCAAKCGKTVRRPIFSRLSGILFTLAWAGSSKLCHPRRL